MRVLLISHTCRSRSEGQPKAQWLGRYDDIELCVLAPDRWKQFGQWVYPEPPLDPSFRFEIGRVKWPSFRDQFYFAWYPELGKLVREFQPDIIDLWQEPWAFVSVHAILMRDRFAPHAKILCETEQNLNKVLPPPFEWCRSFTLRHAAHAVARGPEAASVLRAKGFKREIDVVPNAVDAELFHPLDREKCRRDWNIEGFALGYVGRLHYLKALDHVIGALPLCSDDVQLYLVGGGPEEAALRALTSQLNLPERVHFLGAKKLEELPPFMNAIDALVLYSSTTKRGKEQFGRVIVEAHACATPVIGSTSGAIPSVIGGAGLVAPEQQPQELARVIEELRADPQRRREMGRIGRRQVEENYTWQQVAARMRDVYHKMLS